MEFFELLFREFRTKILVGPEGGLVPKKTSSINYMLCGLAIAHSLLHCGSVPIGLREWVVEALFKQLKAEELIGKADINDIPLDASSADILNFIKELDGASNNEEINDILDANLHVLNMAKWDADVSVCMSNRHLLINEIITTEVFRKRLPQIDGLREGLQKVGIFSDLAEHYQAVKSILSPSRVSLTAVSFLDACILPAALDAVEEVALAYFKQVLTVLDEKQLRQLLQFSTGVPRFPPGGLQKKIVVGFRENNRANIYPYASSCFHLLNLPLFNETKTYNEFQKNFITALATESEGFAGEDDSD